MRNLVIEAEFDGRNFIARQQVDLPIGQRVRLIVQPVVQVASGADLLEYWRRSEVIGAWSDRKEDSAILAGKLRQKAEKRHLR